MGLFHQTIYVLAVLLIVGSAQSDPTVVNTASGAIRGTLNAASRSFKVPLLSPPLPPRIVSESTNVKLLNIDVNGAEWRRFNYDNYDITQERSRGTFVDLFDVAPFPSLSFLFVFFLSSICNYLFAIILIYLFSIHWWRVDHGSALVGPIR